MTNKRTVTLFVGIWVVLTFLSVSFSQTNAQVGFTIKVRDVTPPEASEITAVPSTVDELNEMVDFSANWTDKYELDSWVFAWDMTGSYQNVSYANFTNEWSNTALSITDTNIETKGSINWKIYASDTSGNWGVTPEISLTILGDAPTYDTLITPSGPVNAGDIVTLGANVYDDFNLDKVDLYIDNSAGWYIHDSIIDINNIAKTAGFNYNTIGLSGKTVYWYLKIYDSAEHSTVTATSNFYVN